MSFSRRPNVRLNRGRSKCIKASDVPLAGIWDGGWWDVDDIPVQADNSDFTGVWKPREGSITGQYEGVAPKYRTTSYPDGTACLEWNNTANQKMGFHDLAALASGDDKPLTVVFDIVYRASTGVNNAILSINNGAATPYHYVYWNASDVISDKRYLAGTSTGDITQIVGARTLISRVFTGTAATLRVDEKAESDAPTTTNTTAETFSKCWMGNLYLTSSLYPGNFYIKRWGATTQNLSADQIKHIYQYCIPRRNKWWWLGDSVTYGTGDTDWQTDPGGLRRRLNNFIWENNYPVEFVGNLDDGINFAHTKHSGHGGYDASEMLAYVNTYLGGPEVGYPKFIHVMAGVNDSDTATYTENGFINNYTALLDRIHELSPDSIIVATTCTDVNQATDADRHANILEINSNLPAIWSAYAAANGASSIITYDGGNNANLQPWDTNYYFNDSHPNAAGYDALYGDLEAAITSAFDAL